MTDHIFKKKLFCFIISITAMSFYSPVSALPSLEGIQVYQRNLHRSPERANLADDIDRYHNADDMWDVLRQEFSLQHYEDNPRVQSQIQWIMSHQDFLINSATHAAPYLYYILQQTRKRHLPAEFVLLPMIESAYNPFAYSSAGASGLWQMMPGTASGYGIKQNWWYDGRRDIIVSTKAALDHVSYLSSFFNHNWLLAIAAYDTGEGNVLNAIHRNIRAGYATNFWYLPLAQETRDYVPRLLAMATIIANPDKYPMYLPPVHNAPYLAQIDLGTQIDLKQAAMLAGLSLKKLLQLNPGYNRSRMGPRGPYKIVLPIESVVQFTENLASSPGYEDATYLHYRVKSGENLVAVAKRFNSPVRTIKILNGLVSNKVKVGTNLLIPSHGHLALKTLADETFKTLSTYTTNPNIKPYPKLATVKPQTISPDRNVVDTFDLVATQYQMQPGDTIYMAREGDDIASIAMRFHTSVKSLRHANNLTDSSGVTIGERLIIPTHVASSQYAQVKNQKNIPVFTQDITYTVKSGETIQAIARKFHIPLASLRVANLLANNTIHEGDQLMIPARL